LYILFRKIRSTGVERQKTINKKKLNKMTFAHLGVLIYAT
jgi:hypothetical protein